MTRRRKRTVSVLREPIRLCVYLIALELVVFALWGMSQSLWRLAGLFRRTVFSEGSW